MGYQSHEVRYFVMTRDARSQEDRKRSCIRDSVSGAKAYEMPVVVKDGVLQEYVLHTTADRGVGWSALMWLYHGPPQVNGFLLTDRFHDIQNRIKEAQSIAGLTLSKLEWSVIMNSRAGPWNGGAHNSTMKAAGRELFSVLNRECPLFQYLYEDLALELGVQTSEAAFGTDEHMDIALRACKERWEKTSIGDQTKSSRWWSFESNGKSFLDCRTLTLYVALYMGFKRGWWKTWEQCPLAKRVDIASLPDHNATPLPGENAPEVPAESAADDRNEEEEDDAEPEDRPLSMQSARAELAKKRKKLSHQIKFAASLLSQPVASYVFKASLW